MEVSKERSDLRLHWTVLRQVLTEKEEDEMFSRLAGMAGGLVVFDRHFYQPDWTRLGEKEVNMMNLVREPVSRMVSQYYYLRSSGRWSWRPDQPPRSWLEKSLEWCVRSGDVECQVGAGGQDMILTYFCGSHLQCANSTNPRALQAAKHNLELRSDVTSVSPLTTCSRYSVVGAVEHFNTSLQVLQSYLPGGPLSSM